MKPILIIEDDQDLLRALQIRLTQAGYKVVAAMDGMQGLTLAQQSHPAVILLDLGLPAGDGATVLRRIRTLLPLAQTPVIVISGRDPESAAAQMVKGDISAYLTKPVDHVRLLELIKELMPDEASAAPAPAPARSKVLIVEDDDDMRLGLSLRLQGSGYDVVTAADGATAIMQANRERPDVILLDLGLPAGDGFSVLTKLKTTLPALSSIPVIVLTARDPNLNREKALAAGAEAYMLKPADNDELLATIAQAIRKN